MLNWNPEKEKVADTRIEIPTKLQNFLEEHSGKIKDLIRYPHGIRTVGTNGTIPLATITIQISLGQIFVTLRDSNNFCSLQVTELPEGPEYTVTSSTYQTSDTQILTGRINNMVTLVEIGLDRETTTFVPLTEDMA